MNKETFESWLDCLSELQLKYCIIFLSQILQSYDRGLSWNEIQKDLDEYCFQDYNNRR